MSIRELFRSMAVEFVAPFGRPMVQYTIIGMSVLATIVWTIQAVHSH